MVEYCGNGRIDALPHVRERVVPFFSREAPIHFRPFDEAENFSNRDLVR